MIHPYVLVAAVAVSSAASGIAGWSVRGWKEGAEREAAAVTAQAEYRASVRKTESIADAYLRGKADGELREVEVEKEVLRVVTKPVYLDRCLDDDGLRIIQSDIDFANAQRGLAAEVPASAAAR